jgi:hypothetical protein
MSVYLLHHSGHSSWRSTLSPQSRQVSEELRSVTMTEGMRRAGSGKVPAAAAAAPPSAAAAAVLTTPPTPPPPPAPSSVAATPPPPERSSSGAGPRRLGSPGNPGPVETAGSDRSAGTSGFGYDPEESSRAKVAAWSIATPSEASPKDSWSPASPREHGNSNALGGGGFSGSPEHHNLQQQQQQSNPEVSDSTPPRYRPSRFSASGDRERAAAADRLIAEQQAAAAAASSYLSVHPSFLSGEGETPRSSNNSNLPPRDGQPLPQARACGSGAMPAHRGSSSGTMPTPRGSGAGGGGGPRGGGVLHSSSSGLREADGESVRSARKHRSGSGAAKERSTSSNGGMRGGDGKVVSLRIHSLTEYAQNAHDLFLPLSTSPPSLPSIPPSFPSFYPSFLPFLLSLLPSLPSIPPSFPSFYPSFLPSLLPPAPSPNLHSSFPSLPLCAGEAGAHLGQRRHRRQRGGLRHKRASGAIQVGPPQREQERQAVRRGE